MAYNDSKIVFFRKYFTLFGTLKKLQHELE
jgi:hypothetical protein